MSKGQNSKNNSKKKPAKTMKEKKAAKREKKFGNRDPAPGSDKKFHVAKPPMDAGKQNARP